MTDEKVAVNDTTDAKDASKLAVKWDDSKMQTTYANVVNVSTTREEVSVFFGTNQTWNVPKDKEFDVLLTDRMMLNPYAAKRLSVLLNAVLDQYESRFGPLDIGKIPSK